MTKTARIFFTTLAVLLGMQLHASTVFALEDVLYLTIDTYPTGASDGVNRNDLVMKTIQAVREEMGGFGPNQFCAMGQGA